MVAGMRWTPIRKLEVVTKFRAGTELNLLAYHNDITIHEIIDWNEAYTKHGLDGLCVTKRMTSPVNSGGPALPADPFQGE